VIQESHAAEEKHPPINDEINRKVVLWQGDITRLKIGAITNAANSGLWAGGGQNSPQRQEGRSKQEEENN
jgi:hypothetical protein